MKIRLSVDPHFCGPVSIGSVSLITLVRDRCGLGLAEAKALVDRAVFDGEIVEAKLSDNCREVDFIEEVNKIDGAAIIRVDVVEEM